ncbi:MAG: M56 family metallopeptidase [Planctomycetota bacterium]|jgi:beta-lactamase regulating signal transducer with metallopeptidase domain
MNNTMPLLAEAILDYLLVASATVAVLAPLVWGIIKAAGIRAPVHRQLLWLYCLIGIAVVPALWLYGPKLTLAVLPVEVGPTEVPNSSTVHSNLLVEGHLPDVDSGPTLSQEVLPPGMAHAENKSPTLKVSAAPAKVVLAVFWLAGFIFMVTRLTVGWYRLRKICRSAMRVAQDGCFGAVAGRKLRLFVTSEVGSPACFGILQPSIILPKQMYDNSTAEELRMVLSHELAHIERKDCWTNVLQRLVEAAFFFHPLVWLASYQLTRERERICDNYVISRGVSAVDYTAFLSHVVQQGLERGYVASVALFEGRLLQRVRFLLDPRRNNKTKLSVRSVLVCTVAVLICFAAFGSVRLAAKSGADSPPVSSETADANDAESMYPPIEQVGEAVKKRVTTYSDEGIFTLRDNETARMPVKENFANGTRFDIQFLDSKGSRVLELPTTSAIHDGDSHRTGSNVSVKGNQILCKIQLTPERQDDETLVVVKALFTPMPTPEETDAMLLALGQEGRLRLDFKDITQLIIQYRRREGRFPDSLEQLNKPLPKDLYSPTGEDYRYESTRKRFILSSCGQDGIYGNDDDEIFIAYNHRGKAVSGQRHGLYPLQEEEDVYSQTERTGPSGRRPTGNCSISGRVVSEVTGEPVGHAKVYLFYVGTHDALFIDVATDGSFNFRDIPAGEYSLAVTHTAGFQESPYNPDNKPGRFPPFTLQEGQKLADIVFELKPAFRVSGKVLDENGNPLENTDGIHVLAWGQRTNDEGQPQYYNARQSNINRLDGSYSLYGLDGEPVYVMAIDWHAYEKDSPYPPRYWPGTFSRSQAKPITFDKQWEIENVDIRLQKSGGLVLEGTVADETTGEPVPEAFVVVHHEDMCFDFVTAYTDEQGHYRIEGLGEGEFLAHVDAVHRGFVRTRELVKIKANVGKTTLDFRLGRGVTISGRIVDEEGDDWPISSSHGHAFVKDYPGPDRSFSLTNFRNRHRPKDAGHGSGGSFKPGEGDYASGEMIFPTKSTFIFQGMMPGQTMINFAPKAEGLEVEEILFNGRDIMHTGIETQAGQDINDVTIVVGK